MASMLKFFCFFHLYFILLSFIGEVVTRAKGRYEGMGWDRGVNGTKMHDLKIQRINKNKF